MAATNTAFIFFNSFKRKLGEGSVNLGAANTFLAALHSSAGQCSANSDFSTYASIPGTCLGLAGSARRTLANVVWTNLSASPSSQFAWDSDAVVWTVSTGASATVKFAVFYMSTGAADGIPVGYIGLVAAEQTVNGGNTVTLTPNTYWFRMSG